MRRLGIINAAPVRQTGWRQRPVEAAAYELGRWRRGTAESTALTTAAILFGVSTLTPFIVTAMLNHPAASIADGAGPEITASIAPLIPEQGETTTQNVAIIPASRVPEVHSDAVPSGRSEPEPTSVTHIDSSTDRLPEVAPPAAATEDTVEPDNVTEVYRTEPQDAGPVSDPAAHLQPGPTEGSTEAVAEEPELAEPVPLPMQKPKQLAASQLSASTRAAQVRTDVRMRAGPRNSAAIITVVRGGSKVQVISCEYWCQVAFDGKRGWIYRRFIQGAGS